MSASSAHELDQARHRLYVEGSITPEAYAALVVKAAGKDVEDRQASKAKSQALVAILSFALGALLMLIVIVAARL